MTTDGRRKFIINFTYFLIVTAVVYFIFKYAIYFLMPFFIAYLIAAMLRPVVNFISGKTRINRRIVSLIIVALFYSTIGALLVVICAECFEFARECFLNLPSFYTSTVEPMLKTLLQNVLDLPHDPDATLVSMLERFSDVLSYVGSLLTSLSGTLVSYVSTFAMSMPLTVLKVLLTVISSFYFIADHDLIHEFISKQLGEGSGEKLNAAKAAVREIIFSYFKSYAIILAITFAELTVAMLILRVPGAVMVALLIALFDILPVVGTGTILWPWIAVEVFVNADYGMAIGLFISYVIIFIVRNVIEPKIVGHHVGLHPLVTLLSMFVGTMLFGVVGLFGIPITMALIVDLNEKGVIRVFDK